MQKEKINRKTLALSLMELGADGLTVLGMATAAHANRITQE